jgi:hypothetical protein
MSRPAQRRERLLRLLDVWTLRWGPHELGGAILSAVPIRLLEPMWRACLAAVADGSATDEIRELVADLDCWAAHEWGRGDQ